jgi:hypothetical protein
VQLREGLGRLRWLVVVALWFFWGGFFGERLLLSWLVGECMLVGWLVGRLIGWLVGQVWLVGAIWSGVVGWLADAIHFYYFF